MAGSETPTPLNPRLFVAPELLGVVRSSDGSVSLQPLTANNAVMKSRSCVAVSQRLFPHNGQ
jgi:hypothetical protein